MREEDNIEKEGLQEDNPDIGDNSGDEDFAEYDDLSALEGLPFHQGFQGNQTTLLRNLSHPQYALLHFLLQTLLIYHFLT